MTRPLQDSASTAADELAERTLLLGTVPSDFDTSRHIAIGPWCFSGVEYEHDSWDQLSFVDPFASPEELSAAAQDVWSLFDELLPSMAQSLNQRHGRDYDDGFWSILLMPWLYRLIETPWARWRVVDDLVERYCDVALTVDVNSAAVDWNFQTYQEFIFRGPMSREYDGWLSSCVVDAMAPSRWNIIRSSLVPDAAARPLLVAPGGRASLLGRAFRFLWKRPRFDNVPDVDQATRVLFSLLLSIFPARRRAERESKPLTSVASSPFPDGFRDLLNRLAECTMPASLGADFKHFEAESLATRFRPGRLYVGAITWNVERDVFRAAQAERHGEKVVSVQYGCNYGTALAFDFTARLQYERHAFFTWGWRRHGSFPGRFVPLPSPLLSQYIDGHREVEPQLIMVGTYCHLRFVRAVSLPQPFANVKYRADKAAFLKSLSREIVGHLHYRPYMHGDTELLDAGYVSAIIPGVDILGGPLMPRLMAARLMVIDHPGTTLYRALVANVPSVGFWDTDAWPLTDEAADAFQGLLDVGIVHRTPEEAARHINDVWADVTGWWQTPAVQNARRVWCAQFAQSSRWWRWHWIKALWKISVRP
jgi:putative transferase (TIGR04331 family)